jgi:hypothetical protein
MSANFKLFSNLLSVSRIARLSFLLSVPLIGTSRLPINKSYCLLNCIHFIDSSNAERCECNSCESHISPTSNAKSIQLSFDMKSLNLPDVSLLIESTLIIFTPISAPNVSLNLFMRYSRDTSPYLLFTTTLNVIESKSF